MTKELLLRPGFLESIIQSNLYRKIIKDRARARRDSDCLFVSDKKRIFRWNDGLNAERYVAD